MTKIARRFAIFAVQLFGPRANVRLGMRAMAWLHIGRRGRINSTKVLPQQPRSTSIREGPHDLRYYPVYRLVAWQPHGAFDDALLDNMAAWMVKAEQFSLPFNRYIDLSCLTSISLEHGHLFRVAEQARQYHGLAPVRCALYCSDQTHFRIARAFEVMMDGSGVEARAFENRAAAAAWLQVPVEVLSLSDEPVRSH